MGKLELLRQRTLLELSGVAPNVPIEGRALVAQLFEPIARGRGSVVDGRQAALPHICDACLSHTGDLRRRPGRAACGGWPGSASFTTWSTSPVQRALAIAEASGRAERVPRLG